MLVLTNGTIKIGAVLLPGRKKPSLIKEENGVMTTYGTFTNIESAEKFMEALAKCVNATTS